MGPAAVRVEIIQSGVVAVGVLPASGITDGMIAVFVPTVPIIAAGGFDDLILGIVRSLHPDGLTFSYLRAALRSGYFHLTLSDCHFRLRR